MLDSIIWVQHTTNPLDLVFLDKLINSEPDYRRLYAEDLALTRSPNRATGYDHIENDVTYVKIDDDIASPPPLPKCSRKGRLTEANRYSWRTR